MNTKKIALTGYMGCGKSTIGTCLSALMQTEFTDLDAEIEKRSGMKIADIFKNKGELYFRKKEREILSEILTENKAFILATGGGTPAYYDNMDLLNAHTESFYLRAPVSLLVKNLSAETQKRPLLSHLSEKDLADFIGNHLFERKAFYEKAKHILPLRGQTPEEAAAEIAQILKV